MKYHDWKKINIEVNKLQYISHCILNSKYKLLIYIAIYILTYILIINNISITECMNQNQNVNEANVPQILPRRGSVDENIFYLSLENSQLRERINILERTLRNSLEQRLVDRTHYNNTINLVLEENQSLRDHVYQSYQTAGVNNRIISTLLRENASLRSGIAQEQSGSDSDLEIT